MKKVILSEEQIKRMIDKLVINEQNGVRTESLTVQMGSIWPMGKWKLTEQQAQQLEPKLNQIVDFINKHRGSIVTIQIEAGESQVTNYDNENSSKTKLAPGVLSKNRGYQMVQYLTGHFKNLFEQNLINKMPEIPEPKQIIGSTPYQQGVTNLKDPNVIEAYQKEQFVNAVITTRKDYECLVDMEITIGYYKGKNKATHQCDESIFELLMNGVSIGEVNLNNWGMDTLVQPGYVLELQNYLKSKDEGEKTYDEFVQNGKIKNPNKDRRERFAEKYTQDQGFANPGESPSIPDWVDTKYQSFGYKTPEEYMEAIKTINDTFNNSYGRKTDNNLGGSRSQTLKLNGELAKSIIDRSSDQIILSLKPLVTRKGKYKLFYYQGSHTETPWVTIQSKKSKTPLFNGEPNIGKIRGDEKETILLRTDLCGNPIQNVVTK